MLAWPTARRGLCALLTVPKAAAEPVVRYSLIRVAHRGSLRGIDGGSTVYGGSRAAGRRIGWGHRRARRARAVRWPRLPRWHESEFRPGLVMRQPAAANP